MWPQKNNLNIVSKSELRVTTVSDRVKFILALVFRRQTAVCVKVVDILYNIRNLYVDLYVTETSVGAAAISKGSGLNTSDHFGRVVIGWLCCRLNGTHGWRRYDLLADGLKRCYSQYCKRLALPAVRAAKVASEILY